MSQIAFLKRELEEARERKRRAQDEILVLERLLARHDPDWDMTQPLPAAQPSQTTHKNQIDTRDANFQREWRAIAHFIHQNHGCSGTDIREAFPHIKDSAFHNRIDRGVKERVIRKSGNGRSVRYFKVKGSVIPPEEQQTLPLDAPPKKKKKRKKQSHWKDGPKNEPAATPKVVKVLKRGEITHSDLVKKSGVSAGGVSWVLKWLESQGQLSKRTEGVYAYYSLKEE